MKKETFEKYYIFFLTMIAVIPGLSNDIYVAAVPTIASQWAVPESLVSLTIVLWFASFSFSLLLLGTLSDNIGRKKVLLTGVAIFIITTVLCAMANSIYALLLFRILQGAAAAAPSAMYMSICRDKYDANRRKYILAYITILISLNPLLAPMIGSLLLNYVGWRSIFMFQAILGVIAFALSIGYKETLLSPSKLPFINSLKRYKTVFQNKNYMLTNSALSLLMAPFYGFVAFSPVAYIKIYGLSAQHFSLLFGINAIMSMSGNFLATRLTKTRSDTSIIGFSIWGCLIGSTGILLFGDMHFAAFAAAMCVFTFCSGLCRPLSQTLILEQVSTDIGSASSFLVFYQFISGSAFMALVSMQWDNQIKVFGLASIIVSALVLVSWKFLCGNVRLSHQNSSI